jgi:vitamin B12 transporter
MKKLPLAALFGTAFICLSVSPVVLAADTDPLDTVVVTADRKARTVDETLAPVSIITHKDIEKYHATSLPEVLRRVPGINITNSGGAGKQTGIFLRGTASNQVLVLVDGVKIGSATLGATAFEHLPLDQIERIEVVRGPRSSLYGSEAIGGVIQIFTRKGGKGFQPEITTSIGSHNTQKLDVNLAGGNTTTTWFNANVGTEKTDGINACKDAQWVCAPTPEPDKDGYRRESAALRVGHQFTETTEAEIAFLQAQGNSDYDGTFVNQTDFKQQSLSGTLKHRMGNKALVTAQLGQSHDKTDNFLNGTFATRFNTQRDTASLQADVQVSESGNLTVGTDQQTERVASGDFEPWTPGNQQYDKTSRKNDGLFTSYQHDFGKTNIEVSARSDDNEQFGKHNTGAAAIGHDLTDNLRMKASYGKAFRAPTFNDLYWPSSGNHNLMPETSKNTEIGLDGKWTNGKWSVNAFENKVDNLINWQDMGGEVWLPANIDKAVIRGVELGASTQLAGWDVAANVTVQQPKNAAGTNAGKLLQLRPKQIANLDVDRKLGNVRVGAGIHAESKRYDDVANAEAKKLPGYGTLDLRADYQMAKDWTVGVKVGNVLDKKYQTVQGYNQDGINGLVTVKYAPK